jgi:hypothetical protein
VNMPVGQVPGRRALNQTGDDVLQEEVAFRRSAAGDGEDGANPSRCRHCKRGVALHACHCRGDVTRYS